MTSRRPAAARVAALAATACVAAALVVAASAPAPAPAAAPGPNAAPHRHAPGRPSLTEIEAQFMCPVCGVPLNQAFSPQADRERAFIQLLYARGDTEAQLKRALVDQYGTSVLATPPGHGFDLSAYLVPLGVVLALIAGVAVLLVRWRRQPGAAEAPPPAPAPSPAEARRLDEDLARWGG